MTYRNGDDADEQRELELERQLRALERARTEKTLLEERREALTRSLRDAEDELGRRRAKVPLPLLARVTIASPCHARWDEMKGDERVRHCASCDKDVYDLSEMTTSEAEALLSREGPAACVRLHRRADGTVITSDCPVGARNKRRRRWLAAGAAIAGSAMAAAGWATQATQGEPCVVTPPNQPQTVMSMGAIAVSPPPSEIPVVTGVPAMPPPTTTAPASDAQPHHPRMGHVSIRRHADE
jgi:hypothetical protein